MTKTKLDNKRNYTELENSAIRFLDEINAYEFQQYELCSMFFKAHSRELEDRKNIKAENFHASPHFDQTLEALDVDFEQATYEKSLSDMDHLKVQALRKEMEKAISVRYTLDQQFFEKPNVEIMPDVFEEILTKFVNRIKQ